MAKMGRPKQCNEDRILAFLYDAMTEVPTQQIYVSLQLKQAEAERALKVLLTEGWITGRNVTPQTSSGRKGRPTTFWRVIA